MLQIELAGLKLRNPLILASGILGNSASLALRIEEAGAGAYTTKTITKDARPGYRNPSFVKLETGYLNAVGLANPGIDYFSEELDLMKKLLKIPVILSVGGKDLEEYEYVVKVGVEHGVDAFELNLSCPHVEKMGAELGEDLEAAINIIRRVKAVAHGRPIFLKLSAHYNYLKLAEEAVRAGISGFTAINTLRGLAIDIYARTPILSNIYGGYSGPGIKPIALKVVYDLYERFRNVPIIGVGGVDSWVSALEMILAGASAVGIGSAIATKDLEVFREIIEGLRRYLETEGFRSIVELVGLAHEEVSNPY
ncbi:MAG: dihydroorotate dehydrogenase [Aigarchaeota archaeon]|nr:dihydroorotate dehydrogenase [Aigarchaeota archaeon]MCX8192668.1 dihydroorotate dehydrogenase [Nitrososphaeria archaeon]MDW7985628.1 dihydroorotate dehydrogenase [Nitrososphaerota archaeon]